MEAKVLIDTVMDEIERLTDPNEVVRATNRVIGKINAVINGIRDKVTAVSGGDTTAGYVWDDDSKTLTVPGSIKEINEVWIIENGDHHKMIMKPYWYVQKYDDSYTFCMTSRNKLTFPQGHSFWEAGTHDIVLVVNKAFDRLAKDEEGKYPEEIDIPATWEEAVVAGVISILTLRGKYRDEALYKDNAAVFNQLLPAINNWEELRYPNVETQRMYNYHKPGS